MVPRHKIDISVADLLFAAFACASARSAERAGAEALRAWGRPDDALACLSVRSGFDLLLEALALPAGSELLVSAVTHPHMALILERHGLVPVPVDLDATTLEPRLDLVERGLSERTRGILVAHLFGSRVDLAPLAAVARSRGLLLVEDCAQSLGVWPPRGDPLADVSMFSFGPIKTATALGGAVLRVADAEALARMRALQERRPEQKRSAYAGRVGKFLFLALLARPAVYGALARVVDLDRVAAGSVRGFPGEGDELFASLRARPSAPLLAVLARRLRTFDRTRIRARAETGEAVARSLSPRFVRPGRDARERTHWVFPVVAPDPPALVAALRDAGFDAARGTTAIGVVSAPADRPELEPREACALLESVVFLPVHSELGARRLRALVQAANASLLGARARELSVHAH